MEKCLGCGAEADAHPIVGVGRAEDHGMKTPDGMSGLLPFNVCKACWVDPAHRSRPLKVHFFERSAHDLAAAVAKAGGTSVQA